MKNYLIENFNSISSITCPCGDSKRAFVTPDNKVATVHLVDISTDAKVHYHKIMTEIYVILEADQDAYMELDGEKVPVQAMSTVLIKPSCRHRAVGKMKILNIPVLRLFTQFFGTIYIVHKKIYCLVVMAKWSSLGKQLRFG